MNKIIVIGHLGRDPEMRYLPSGGGVYVYRGNRLPGLRGLYVYGDYTSGCVWTLKWNGSSVDFNRQVSNVSSLCSFGEDEAGELFAVSLSGSIYMFNAPGAPTTFPTRLSQTGLFQNTATMSPAPGLIEYSVNSPLWSDNATKRRWIALPGNDRITYRSSDNWTFPVGTVMVKHFDLEMQVGNPGSARRLETRVLINEQNGWAGYTYKWNNAQTDATLLASGDNDQFTIQDASAPGGTRQQTWQYPSRADCMGCHTDAAGHVLGARAKQLNGDFDYPTMRDNQLRSWDHINLFTTAVSHQAAGAMVDPHDTSASTSARARSYLSVNCAMCHMPNGPTPVNMDFRFERSRAQMNAIDVRPTTGSLGIADAYRIRSGDKDRSIVWHRMGLRTFQGMPTIGSRMVDAEGRAMIGAWIDAGAN